MGELNPPTCPNCGSQAIEASQRFVLESNKRAAEAADEYYTAEDRSQFDTTPAYKCKNGHIWNK